MVPRREQMVRRRKQIVWRREQMVQRREQNGTEKRTNGAEKRTKCIWCREEKVYFGATIYLNYCVAGQFPSKEKDIIAMNREN